MLAGKAKLEKVSCQRGLEGTEQLSQAGAYGQYWLLPPASQGDAVAPPGTGPLASGR